MKKIRIPALVHMKQRQEKIVVLTCYDASFIQVLNAANIEVVLIGDTLGQIIQGYDTTIPVSIPDMVYHIRCVARKNTTALLIGDMPFLSYTSIEQALDSAKQLMQAGAEMVKMEGGRELAPIVQALSQHGIPVCAHIGLTPQFVHHLGGYKIQGREQHQAAQLLDDALALQHAGAALLVLECVPRTLAHDISQSLAIPTIGIGAGVDCDGQVLVCYDMLGLNMHKKLTFVKDFLHEQAAKQTASTASEHLILAACCAYHTAVKQKTFPSLEHSFE